MSRFMPVRSLAVLLAAGSLVAVPLAASASAVTATTCGSGKIVFSTTKFTATSPLVSCSNPTATGGKGTAVLNFKVITAITGKITWNKTGTTTLKISAKAGPAKSKCAAGSTEEIATGVVTGGTGAALKGIPTGAKFSESLCITTKLALSLYPGTKIIL
jgi:hypothetical protein